MSAVSAGSDEILQRLVDAFVFSVAFDAVEPLALGEFGTCVAPAAPPPFPPAVCAGVLTRLSVSSLYVLGFGLISIAAHLATDQIATSSLVDKTTLAGDTLLFLLEKARDLVRLMFSALSGRYVVNLFQTAKDNAGYVLFIVVSAVVLLKMADHAMKTPAAKRM